MLCYVTPKSFYRSRTEVWGRNSTSTEHISQSERLRAAQDAGGFSRSCQWLSGGHGPVQYSAKVTSSTLYGKILNLRVEQKWLFYSSSVASIRMTRSLWRACRRWRRRRVPRMPRWSWTVTIWRAAGRREIWRAVTARRRSGPIRSSGLACSDPHLLRDSWASALQKKHPRSWIVVCVSAEMP